MRASAIACILCSAAASATETRPLVAILEFRNDIPGVDARTNRDGSYLADVARTRASESGLRVMTRENLVVLLKATGSSPSDCIDKCEIETGRLLGADYVVSGNLLRFGTELRLSLRLHETVSGTLVDGGTVAGADLPALEAGLPDAMGKLVASIHQARPAAMAPVRDEEGAARLANLAEERLKARDFQGAVVNGNAALRDSPLRKSTLAQAYRALGYGHAYLGDKAGALKYLSRYLPFCGNDCDQVRTFGATVPAAPAIRHTGRAQVLAESEPFWIRASILSELPIAAASVELPGARLALLENEPGEFVVEVPAALAHGKLEYAIAAEDVAGMKARVAEDDAKRPFAVAFQKPPVIEHEPPRSPPEGQELRLRAHIVSGSPITVAVAMTWPKGHRDSHEVFNLEPAGDGFYEWKLPAAKAAGEIEYLIMVRSADGLVGRSASGDGRTPFSVAFVKK